MIAWRPLAWSTPWPCRDFHARLSALVSGRHGECLRLVLRRIYLLFDQHATWLRFTHPLIKLLLRTENPRRETHDGSRAVPSLLDTQIIHSAPIGLWENTGMSLMIVGDCSLDILWARVENGHRFQVDLCHWKVTFPVGVFVEHAHSQYN